MQHKITLAALSQLLKVLNQVDGINLPLAARTLLKTPSQTQIVPMGSGEFWYDGIAKNLIHSLSSLHVLPGKIELIVNVDGIPPFDATQKLWQILGDIFMKFTYNTCKIYVLDRSPFSYYMQHLISSVDHSGII